MTLVDVAEISLIIDDNNKTSFKVDLNNFDEEALSTICNDISSQYHLSVKATEKIYQHALTEINNARNTIHRRLRGDNSSNEITARLYYEGTQKKKEQKERNARILQEKINNEIKQYSFCPNSASCYRINTNINSNIGKSKSEVDKAKTRKSIKTKANCDTFSCDLRTKSYSNSLTTINNNNQFESQTGNSTHSNHIETKIKKNNSNLFNKSASTIKANHQTIHDSPNNTSNKWFDRLHNTKAIVQKKKEQLINRFYEFQCPFEPNLSKGSLKIMRNRKESPEAAAKRLSESKLYSAFSKSIMTLTNKAESNSRSHSKSDKSLSLSTIKPYNKSNSLSSMSLSRKSSDPNRKRVVEQRSEQSIITAIGDIEKIKERNMNYYRSTSKQSAERYKVNAIKSIYEIIAGKPSLDFNDLASKEGIPKHIVDKVVIPTCYMITNKNLEFTFQNFYLISADILNNNYF